MIRTYKYRLYPNKSQRQQLGFLLCQSRNLYNAALEQRIKHYEATQETLSYADQWAHFRDVKNAKPATLGQLNATSVQQLLRRLDKAFKAFFRRIKAGDKPGFPRFKGPYHYKSMEYRYGDGCKLRFTDKGNRFYVYRVGEIRLKYHRSIPDDGIIKHVIIKHSSGKWYVCFQVHLPDPEPVMPDLPPVGIDMGLSSLLALSDGSLIENPRWLRSDLAKLRIAQRRLHRRKKGSKRRRKAAQQVATLYEKITNKRRDFWHKLTRNLVDQYGLIGIENLTLEFMTHHPRLALSAHDASLGLFQQLLVYKAEEAGTEVIAVKPQYTSQCCSTCGELVKKDLSVRIHQCPHCGLSIDRDINAAINILNLALNKPLGRSGQDRTWAVAPSVS